MNKHIYTKIKNNLHTSKVIECKMKDIKEMTINNSGIYILINERKVYIGKSINIVNRIKTHKNEIENKTHYNKSLVTFDVKKTHCILIPCLSIDTYERYYINLFSKLKLSNVIIPSYKGELNYIDFEKYVLRHRLKKLNKSGRVAINNLIFKDCMREYRRKININRMKGILCSYTEVVQTIGKIKFIERSKLATTYHFDFYNSKYQMAVHQNMKNLQNLKNINLEELYPDIEIQRKLEIIIFPNSPLTIPKKESASNRRKNIL